MLGSRDLMSTRVRGALGLLAVLAAAAAAAFFLRRPSPPAVPRLIVVGLDAADWQLLDGYVAAGAMPELARLQREGRSGVLRAFVPSLSPLLWTTMMTGRGPLEHGILDFTRFNPRTGAREPITSDERRARAVWEIAGDAGRRVAVFGLWATYPAEPVRGLMVSDRFFSFHRVETELPPGAVSPLAEQERLRARRDEMEAAVGFASLQAYLPWLGAAEYQALSARDNPYAHPATALRRILVETRLYHRLALETLERERPPLTIVYIQGTDSIGHVFAPFAPPRQPSIAPEDFERYGGVPEAYFREVDGLLGDYRRRAEKDGAALLLVSDHGFLWKEGRPARPDSQAAATAGRWHRDQGIYLVWGRGVSPDGTRGEGKVGQVAATILALLGLPRGAGLEGPALAGLRESEQRRDYGPRAPLAPPVSGDDAAAREALEKLRALGYVGGSEPGARAAGAAGTRSAGSYNNEGLLLREAGRAPEARAAFEAALRTDPHLASAAHNLSVMLTDSEPARADTLLLEALAGGLGNGPPIVASAIAAHEAAGQRDRARRLLDGAIERLPDDPLLRLQRGRARLAARNCGGALADLERGRRAAPQVALLHGLAGTALLCLGRRGEAVAALQRSLELDPSQGRLREQLARLR
jgi:tetratricopeptide (TPR) repeat protein